MINIENDRIQQTKRQEYLEGTLSHADYYVWLAEFIGVTTADVPANTRELQNSKDEHFNDIPLTRWDKQDINVRPKAFAKGLAWSLSDTVCVLKALATQLKQ